MQDLSGGQKARVVFAELSLKAPDVLILVRGGEGGGPLKAPDVLILVCGGEGGREEVPSRHLMCSYWCVEGRGGGRRSPQGT